MNPTRGQLESPSVGMGLETPGQQCLPNWEIGRTTAGGCLLAGASSNLGGNTFSLTEIVVGTRADNETATPSTSSKPVFLQTSRKPGKSEPASEENKQFDPGEKEGSHRFEKRMYWYSFIFLGGTLGSDALLVSCAFFLSVCCVLFLSGDHFPAS